MGFVLFLVVLGGGYAVAHDVLGLSVGASSAAAWAMAFTGMFLWRRRRGYRAAFRVERYRAAAEHMRVHQLEMDREILSHAAGSEAESAALRNPDAYVALFLAEAEDMGYGYASPGTTAHGAGVLAGGAIASRRDEEGRDDIDSAMGFR
jgi:hypothetical protein